jgi:hypothetical protein
MRRILTLLLALSCGGKYRAPPPVASIPLPDGSQLKPYDATKPGKARPQVTVLVNNKVYVTLSNQRDASPFPVNAGPGFLAAVVPSSSAPPTLIDLSTAGGCDDPGFVRASSDGKLYAPCSGNFSGSDDKRAIVEVDPLSNVVTRRAAIPNGKVPNGVALTATKIWTGDAFSTTVFSIDRASFTADSTAPISVDCPKQGFNYVADVLTIRGDVYALCASDTSGVLYRLDGATGQIKSQVAVGATPAELTGMDDGRIAVVNAGDNTLSLVTLTTTGMTSEKVLTFSSQTATLQDIKAFGQFLFTAASGSNTAQKIDLNAKGGPKVIAEANFGLGAGPYNIQPLDEDQAIVANRGTNTIAAAQWVTAP